MIEKHGNKWVVKSKRSGRTLGEHESEEKAKRQLRAIEASKHMRGKRRR